MKKVCVLMSLIVIICAGQGYAEEPLQPMAIQLSWLPTVYAAGILLAEENGWYEDAGIDVAIKGWESGVSIVDEVMSGRA
ncbi:MAG: ABC transporter substrate-binding protein [bacterium]|nr:ABC transporter substrate-binding protein [bacterium]